MGSLPPSPTMNHRGDGDHRCESRLTRSISDSKNQNAAII
ncbi:hypothetical protein RBSWK_02317 [Rhodopirellula baltica SWK14]|uniref:Uncharacterized protein n=2 Tax=Rhodopirellula baltica TaxID=265606 RepID=Q7UTJ4_RHOBA|nr:hypothetical protein RBSWK_02317 [Rhodopirellula baltica SWK14]CAD73442.1 hypothetical protein RB3846 [Rhodopirellula baltica SH 1]